MNKYIIYSWETDDTFHACFIENIKSFVHDDIVTTTGATVGVGPTKLLAAADLLLKEHDMTEMGVEITKGK